MTALQQQGAAAKAATYTLAIAGSAKKNEALNAIADVLSAHQDEWLAANAQDVQAAKAVGMRPAMLDSGAHCWNRRWRSPNHCASRPHRSGHENGNSA